jgi:hypothetical protein
MIPKRGTTIAYSYLELFVVFTAVLLEALQAVCENLNGNKSQTPLH